MENIKDTDIEDLTVCSELLVKSMMIREKYMMLSQQSFSNTTSKYLCRIFSNQKSEESKIHDSQDLGESILILF